MSHRPSVGVLGGTFNPVHLGHLALASRALERLPLCQVRLLPAATPPHKSATRIAPVEHRLEMLRLAVQGLARIEVSTLEVDRGGVSYSIDTLRALRDGDEPCDPLFIVGMDSLLEIPTWQRFEELLDEFHFLVFDRPDMKLDAVRDRLHSSVLRRLYRLGSVKEAPEILAPTDAPRVTRVFHAGIEPIPISSRGIRLRASRGESLDALVPCAVAEYILANGIYRQEERH